jgi:hypothetical protein
MSLVNTRKERVYTVNLAPSDLTAPISATIEMNKLYIEVTDKCDQLAKQTRVIYDDDGNPSVFDHPDLKEWIKIRAKLLTEVAKLNANIELKAIENKLSALDIILRNTDKIDPHIMEQFVAAQMKNERR